MHVWATATVLLHSNLFHLTIIWDCCCCCCRRHRRCCCHCFQNVCRTTIYSHCTWFFVSIKYYNKMFLADIASLCCLGIIPKQNGLLDNWTAISACIKSMLFDIHEYQSVIFDFIVNMMIFIMVMLSFFFFFSFQLGMAATQNMAKHSSEPMFVTRSETFKFVAGEIIHLPCEVSNAGNFIL